jgi:hypothetical protein
MTDDNIKMLLKMRIAVYKEGCKKGFWTCLEDNAAKDYMQYLFPKTAALAFYNLMVNVVNKVLSEHIPAEMYSLYKCPVQLEEEMYEYLKKHLDEDVLGLNEEPISFLSSLATIACDPALGSIYIGQLSDDFENKIRVMAFHFKNAFQNNYFCYPYFN